MDHRFLKIVARFGDTVVSEVRKERDVKRCEILWPMSQMPKEARHDWVELRAVAETKVIDKPS